MILKTMMKSLDLILQAVELIEMFKVRGRRVRLTFRQVTDVMNHLLNVNIGGLC